MVSFEGLKFFDYAVFAICIVMCAIGILELYSLIRYRRPSHLYKKDTHIRGYIFYFYVLYYFMYIVFGVILEINRVSLVDNENKVIYIGGAIAIFRLIRMALDKHLAHKKLMNT